MSRVPETESALLQWVASEWKQVLHNNEVERALELRTRFHEILNDTENNRFFEEICAADQTNALRELDRITRNTFVKREHFKIVVLIDSKEHEDDWKECILEIARDFKIPVEFCKCAFAPDLVLCDRVTPTLSLIPHARFLSLQPSEMGRQIQPAKAVKSFVEHELRLLHESYFFDSLDMMQWRTQWQEKEEGKAVTYVTMIYDIRTPEIKEGLDVRSSKSVIDYWNLAKDGILQWNVPLFVVCEPFMVKHVLQYRKSLGLEKNTFVYPLAITDGLLGGAVLEQLQSLHREGKIPRNFNPKKDTARYVWSQWRKYEALAIALEQNIWRSKSFFFVDFGINHVTGKLSSFEVIFLNNFASKVPKLWATMLFPSAFRKTLIETDCWHNYIEKFHCPKQVTAKTNFNRFPLEVDHTVPRANWFNAFQSCSGGGFIGGPQIYVRWLCKNFIREALQALTRFNATPLDEAVLGVLVLQRPDMFIVHHADHCEILTLPLPGELQTSANILAKHGLHEQADAYRSLHKNTQSNQAEK